MSKHFDKALLAEHAELVAAPRPNRIERTFDLHPTLFALTIGCYFAFLGVMAAAFMNAELALPFVIFAVYIAMAFAVPGWWAKVRGLPEGPRQSWAEFMREGIQTGSGRLSGSAAIWQVLTVPALILLWGVGIAFIRASL